MEEDKELQDIIEMEFEYKKSCELHEQFTIKVIHRRLSFQNSCSHVETYIKDYINPLNSKAFHTYYCKRCNKYLYKKRNNESNKSNIIK